MLIRFTKGKGKPDTLACVREDGSCTWAALNFTAHDFGHYAIETTMGWREAFFGLLAQGWDIADFGQADPATGKKPAVPLEAMQAEMLASLVDMERHSGAPLAYAIYSEMLASVCAGQGIPPPDVTPEQLAAIRSRHTDLVQYWERLSVGECMELTF